MQSAPSPRQNYLQQTVKIAEVVAIKLRIGLENKIKCRKQEDYCDVSFVSGTHIFFRTVC